jgi:hypothetical protein
VVDSNQFFHDFVGIFHISIKCVTDFDEQLPSSYTQKEIQSLILKYAKNNNVSTVVFDNIDKTYVTYYNELNSVIGWFRWFFWIVIILFLFLLNSFLLHARIRHRLEAAAARRTATAARRTALHSRGGVHDDDTRAGG